MYVLKSGDEAFLHIGANQVGFHHLCMEMVISDHFFTERLEHVVWIFKDFDTADGN